MAKTKSKGTTALGRDSISKRLGVKIFGDGKILPGQIIIRQRGTKFYPGKNVGMGKDNTLYALAEGRVKFLEKKARKFTGKLELRTFVSVEKSVISNL